MILAEHLGFQCIAKRLTNEFHNKAGMLLFDTSQIKSKSFQFMGKKLLQEKVNAEEDSDEIIDVVTVSDETTNEEKVNDEEDNDEIIDVVTVSD